MEIELRPQAPFNFELSLKNYTRSKFEAVDMVDGDRYYRVIRIGKRIYRLDIRSEGSIERPLLVAKIYGRPPGKKEVKDITDYLEILFRADYDLRGFYRFCRNDKTLKRFSKWYYGLKNLQTVDVFEILVWAITGQQMNLAFAYSLKKRLTEKYGRRYDIGGKSVYTFPEADVLAGAKAADLMNLKYSRNKAEYIKGLASRVAEGKLELEKLRKFDDNKVREILTGIRGVGSWSCEYSMLRSLSRDDACPSGDAGLRRALALYYGLDKKSGERDIERFMERFKPYRGVVTYYLWFGLLHDGTKG